MISKVMRLRVLPIIFENIYAIKEIFQLMMFSTIILEPDIVQEYISCFFLTLIKEIRFLLLSKTSGKNWFLSIDRILLIGSFRQN